MKKWQAHIQKSWDGWAVLDLTEDTSYSTRKLRMIILYSRGGRGQLV